MENEIIYSVLIRYISLIGDFSADEVAYEISKYGSEGLFSNLELSEFEKLKIDVDRLNKLCVQLGKIILDYLTDYWFNLILYSHLLGGYFFYPYQA